MSLEEEFGWRSRTKRRKDQTVGDAQEYIEEHVA